MIKGRKWHRVTCEYERREEDRAEKKQQQQQQRCNIISTNNNTNNYNIWRVLDGAASVVFSL
jgi:hypothetical protein